MNDIAQLHRSAMDMADQAAVHRRNGNRDLALEFTRKAFVSEREAAKKVEGQLQLEPTRSVLHRSAASLALECDEIREAERLIASALSGNPPEEIAEELRDLLEDVYFHRHLSLRGIVLQPDEFQLSIEGEGVGFGIAPMAYVLSRARDIGTLIFRTAERMKGLAFRESGRRSKDLAEELELYVSVPRASSFAVSIRVGSSQLELDLPDPSFPREVISDVFDCFDLLNSDNVPALQEQIQDESYFNNFLGLAKKIAPDGRRVRRVGFTSITDQGERRLALLPKLERAPEAIITPNLTAPDSIETVEGILLEADAKDNQRGRIQVVDDHGHTHRFRIPRGMMSDVVRPMFEERVVVVSRRKGSGRFFESIDLVDAE